MNPMSALIPAILPATSHHPLKQLLNKISQRYSHGQTHPTPSFDVRPAPYRQNNYRDWENDAAITAEHKFGAILDEIETQPINIRPGINKMVVGYATHRGVVKKNNQDCLTTVNINQTYHLGRTPVQLSLVADGMGGYESGEIASQIAVSTARKVIERELNRLVSQKLNYSTYMEKLLTHAICSANKAVMSYAAANQSRMGTTLIAALVVGQNAYIINVGDSRVYHFTGRRLNLLTEDHSLVFHLYKTKKISYEDMRRHPKRNLLLNSLGQSKMEQQLSHMKYAANHPYFFQQKVMPGETLLLCTDGLWNMVEEKQIATILAYQTDPQLACNTLVQMANANGGRDNISLIVSKMTN